MKHNDFITAVQTIQSDLTVRVEAAQTAYNAASAENSQVSADERNKLRLALKELQTKLRYVRKLADESVSKKAASYVKDSAMLSSVISDSYMIDKFVDIISAVVNKRKIESDDYALVQAIAYLVATDFKSVSHDTLRKNLTKKSDVTKCHDTTRQASMICLLFERLNAAKRIKLNDVKATEFDVNHAIVKDIENCYQ